MTDCSSRRWGTATGMTLEVLKATVIDTMSASAGETLQNDALPSAFAPG